MRATPIRNQGIPELRAPLCPAAHTRGIDTAPTKLPLMHFVAGLDATAVLWFIVSTADIYFWIILVWFTQAMFTGTDTR